MLLAGLAVAWAVLLATGPWVAGLSDAAGGLVYAAGSLICHQRPERSFHLGAAQLPVCARCLGLYAGAALGLAAWAFSRRRRDVAPRRAIRALVVSGAPTAVTVGSAWLGFGDPANVWRAATALPLGVVAGLVAGAVTTNHLK